MLGLYESISALATKVNRLCCAVQQLQNGGGGSYLKYVALLSPPIGDDGPVATILENTIGNIVWERSAAGIYSGTNENFVDETKVFMSFTPNVSGEGDGNVTIVGGEIYNSVLWFSTTIFQTGLLGDTWGTYLPIEIRVYP